MVSERRIAANRRNARKSTGPRSSIGKRRTSRNAYSHGLTASATPKAKYTKRIEKLARKIAGNTTDVVILECARDAAHAEFDLAQIRRVKIALIERMSAFGELEALEVLQLEAPERIKAWRTVVNFVDRLMRGRPITPEQELGLIEADAILDRVRTLVGLDLVLGVHKYMKFMKSVIQGTAILPEQAEAAATMPSAQSERLAEAVRRALPELLKLDRYERRAAAARERSVRAIGSRMKSLQQLLVV